MDRMPFKRCFDFSFSLLGLAITIVPMLVIGLLVRATSPGPALFCQKRVGRRGRLFTVVKFRTMCPDAEKLGSITSSGDGRITPVGRLLRRFKLDELPQLWNVFTGAMSFVGPRPDVPGYADRLTGSERRLLELRPGITGPATLYFRNEEALLLAAADPKAHNDTVIWPKKVALNLRYMEEWSLWKDVGYILMTVVPSLDGIFNRRESRDHGKSVS